MTGHTASSVVRVLVVDDHPVVRDGVTTQLRPHADIDVVGYAADGADAVRTCAQLLPDVILLDLRLPDTLAADLVPRLHTAHRPCRIVLFTAFPEHAAVAPSLAAGACGLLVKDVDGPTLRDALREVARTGTYRSDGRSPRPASAITPREYDVLRLVATGATNAEVGAELGLSINTVKAYLRHVMDNLGARNRTQLITKARSHGLL